MIDIDVSCEECGAILDVITRYGQRDVTLEVKPCSYCLETAKEEGYKEGKDS